MPMTPQLVHIEFCLAVAGWSLQVGKAPVSDTETNGTWFWLRRGDPDHERGAYQPVKLSKLAGPPHWKPSKSRQINWYMDRTNRVFPTGNGACPVENILS